MATLDPAPLTFAAQGALALACAAAAGGPRPARIAVALGLAGMLAMPYTLAPEHFTLRGFSALFALMFVIRGSDLLRERPRPLLERLVHACSIADLRLAARVAPNVRVRLLVTGVACALLATPPLMVAAAAPEIAEPWPLLQRWGCGTIGFYLSFEAIDRLARVLYGLVGFEVEPGQRMPIAARTIAEFWGIRWNSIVRRWLSAVAFLPLARRGRPVVGGLLAFALSALIHAYLLLPAVGVRAAALMGGFFLLQGVFVAIERALGVARWPRPLGHAWTIVLFLASVPLFLDPLLQVFGFAPMI
ncbi:hypothetical protein LBMAG42_21400 [Deltaproteobacteria bacterium]|nr:hypothetical protein LBMAG42_21400 [Deltaproteobacteria bacterium]